MTASSSSQNVSRKVLILGLAIVAFCLLYTAAWYTGTAKARSWLESRLQMKELSISCPGMEFRGFPFRVGVFCDSMALKGQGPMVAASTGAVRSAAQVYDPGHAVFELDGPVIIQQGPGLQAEMNWQLLHGSVNAGLAGVDRTSIEADDFSAKLVSSMASEALQIDMKHGELHMRQNQNDLDVAAIANSADIRATFIRSARPLLDFSVSIDATLAKLAPVLRGVKPSLTAGVSGQIHRLVLDFGDRGALTLSGPFTRSPDGLISGSFDLEAENFTELAKILTASLKDAEDVINMSEQLLTNLSRDGKSAKVRLDVRNGTILLGLIPIGFIPPV